MSAMIPFAAGSVVPAYLKNKTALTDVNRDAISQGPSYPTMSIKGKVFTLIKDGFRKTLMRLDDPDETLGSINLAVLRVNNKARVYFDAAFDEKSADRAKPTCYTMDGVAPAPAALSPQSKKCGTCPHAVWGSRRPGSDAPEGEAKGTACAINTRIAVAAPDKLDEVYLLRVPPASRPALAEAIKAGDARGIPYNAMVLKVAFDKEAASPKLTFKPVGLLDDAGYASAQGLYNSDTVKEIVGLIDRPAPAVAAEDPVDEVVVAPAPVAAPAAESKAAGMLSEMDGLLDGFDD